MTGTRAMLNCRDKGLTGRMLQVKSHAVVERDKYRYSTPTHMYIIIGVTSCLNRWAWHIGAHDFFQGLNGLL